MAYMRRAAERLNRTQDPDELNRLLDDLEYLYEAVDPELQYLAEDLMQRIRHRLGNIG